MIQFFLWYSGQGIAQRNSGDASITRDQVYKEQQNGSFYFQDVEIVDFSASIPCFEEAGQCHLYLVARTVADGE